MRVVALSLLLAYFIVAAKSFLVYPINGRDLMSKNSGNKSDPRTFQNVSFKNHS